MTEKDIRKRLDEVTKQLDEERAKNAKLTEVVADLAKAAAAGALPVGQPWVPYPVPMPQPQPAYPPWISWTTVVYMASFGGINQDTGQSLPTATYLYTEDPPGQAR